MIIFIDENIFEKQVYGGISRYFCELAKAISEHPEHTVIIYGGWSKNVYLDQLRTTSNLKILNLSTSFQWLKFAKNWFNPIIRKSYFLKFWFKKQTIIYHPSYFSLDPFINKHCNASVLTVHDLIYEQQDKNKNSKKVEKRKSIQGQVDQIITVSESTARDLTIFNPPVAGKISIIHLAATPPEQTSDLPSNRNNTFIFIGKRGGYKNGRLAIEGLRQFRKETTIDAKLLFIGGGAFNEAENKLIRHFALQLHVEQKNLSDTELAHAYQISAALLFPSSYEGFGLPPLEAMQHNCPVIAQHVSSIPEVLGGWGHYLSPPSAIELSKLMKEQLQPEDAETVTNKQRLRNKQLGKFSWEQTASKTISVYQNQIDKQQPHTLT